MAKVTGVGGVFFKSDDPAALRKWYHEHLGIDVQDWGAVFLWKRDRPHIAYTVWSPFPADTTYFEPSGKPFMINLRVDDLQGLLARLRASGARVLDRFEKGENGDFGYVLDPEGNLLELWQQKDDDPYVPKE
jgi:catechol 2,3-dioxygenase-like lactoylglutathione lyase family enzyme